MMQAFAAQNLCLGSSASPLFSTTPYYRDAADPSEQEVIIHWAGEHRAQFRQMPGTPYLTSLQV